MLSKVANSIRQSNARQLYDMSRNYSDVIDLTIGDPDFLTPSEICDGAISAIKAGKTKYTANCGLLELRQAISKRVLEKEKTYIDPQTQIVVTTGAMAAIYLVIKATINPGDEVVIPEPAWVNYGQMVTMSGGKSVYVKPSFEMNVSLERIVNAITDKTSLIIINNPCNPTGQIVEEDVLDDLMKICDEKGIVLVVDEVYSGIVFDDFPFVSVASKLNGYRNAVLIDSFSKKYSMTGWRVGFAIGDESIISAVTRLQENVNACCPEPSQYAAICALSLADEPIKMMAEEYQKRRNIFIDGINHINGMSYVFPKGTFYVFVKIKELGLSSIDFSYELLKRNHVSVVPGITYGESGEGYVRVSLTKGVGDIIEAINRIEAFVQGHCDL